jgi:alpha-amylase/alpha-mannosidase (GH57 family)
MRKLDDLKPAEIKEAAAALAPEHGHFEAYQIQGYIADRLGSATWDDDALPSGYQKNAVQERYFGRVKRALDALAGEKVLIRVGANQVLPSGLNSYNTVHYFTPEEFARQNAEGDARRREQQAEAFRNDEIRRRLAAGGFTNGTAFTTADWERILDMAEL